MGRTRVLALLIAACAQAGIGQSIAVAPSTISGIEITGPLSPTYDACVDKILGITRSETLNAWLPYGIVLKNATSQIVVAVAIRWEVANPSGGTSSFLVMHQAWDPARQEILPGKSVVAIPGTLLLDGVKSPKSTANLGAFQSALRMKVTLDGVVFASGRFAGPDTAHEYETYQVNTTVPTQVAAKVLEMKAAGVPIADVVAWLETTSTAPNPHDLKANVTARTARQLLQRYKQKGEPSLYQMAQSQSQPPIQLYR